MSARTYRRIIQEWCAADGMQTWEPGDDMHLEISATTIGLIYDEEQSPEILHIFLDTPLSDEVDAYRWMLEKNMSTNRGSSGFFALHPTSGRGVYRVDIPLTDDLDGAHMTDLLLGMVIEMRGLTCS